MITKMDLIKYLLEKPTLIEHLVRWQSFLSQFNITYVTQKAIKGYAIVEHLAHLPLPVFDEINLEFLDEDLMTIQDPRDLIWSFYFDEAMNMKGRRIGQCFYLRKVWQSLGLINSPSLLPITLLNMRLSS